MTWRGINHNFLPVSGSDRRKSNPVLPLPRLPHHPPDEVPNAELVEVGRHGAVGVDADGKVEAEGVVVVVLKRRVLALHAAVGDHGVDLDVLAGLDVKLPLLRLGCKLEQAEVGANHRLRSQAELP